MKAGILIGSKGTLGPTLAFLLAKVSKSATRLLPLIIAATVGLHSGVAGTDAAAASKIDDIKLCSPRWKHVNQQDYKVTEGKATVFHHRKI
jgi:hypothetical protein